MIEAKPLSSGNLAIIEDYSNKINNKYLTQYKPQTPEPSAITSTIKGWLPSIKSTGQFIGKKVSSLHSENLKKNCNVQ